MAKRAYELSEDEAALALGLREGRLILPCGERWVRLTPKEEEAVLLCRKVQHGPITFLLKYGEPVEAQAEVRIRLGQDDDRAELVRELRKQ